jgi:hypothetical protein
LRHTLPLFEDSHLSIQKSQRREKQSVQADLFLLIGKKPLQNLLPIDAFFYLHEIKEALISNGV